MHRTSPAEFIIPFDKYVESAKFDCSIGMRFRMTFEGEEAPEQRFELSHLQITIAVKLDYVTRQKSMSVNWFMSLAKKRNKEKKTDYVLP